MKAPDKIYVEVCEDGIFAFEKPPFEESIEYVRKDALMEWLENKVSLSYGVATDALVEVIDKLNSL